MRIVVSILLGLVTLLPCKAQNLAPSSPGFTTLGADTIFCPDINQGDTVEAVYYFQNTSSIPFVIWQVHPGCQCTAPQYPEDTLQPGRLDSITLVFYSRKSEEPEFYKYAIVLTPVGEKTYYLVGIMHKPPFSDGVKLKKTRITNRTKFK